MNKEMWNNHKQNLVKVKGIRKRRGKCKKCGWKKRWEILEFHHRKEKVANISKMTFCKWEMVKKELRKCDLLCPNCHKVLHLKEREKK